MAVCGAITALLLLFTEFHQTAWRQPTRPRSHLDRPPPPSQQTSLLSDVRAGPTSQVREVPRPVTSSGLRAENSVHGIPIPAPRLFSLSRRAFVPSTKASPPSSDTFTRTETVATYLAGKEQSLPIHEQQQQQQQQQKARQSSSAANVKDEAAAEATGRTGNLSREASGSPEQDGMGTSLNDSRGLPFLDPQQRYLVIEFYGRLGNVLFELAATYCIAKQNNLTLVLTKADPLQDLNYQGLILQTKSQKQLLARLSFKSHVTRVCCGFQSRLMTPEPADTHHFMIGYFQSWRYFEPCKTQVKQTIKFTDSVIGTAVSIVTNLRKKLPRRTLVGVHVRMEDYLRRRAINNGKKIAPPDFYRRAMTYFRSNFSKVTFVVIVSNDNWFKNHVSNAPDVLMLGRSSSAAVDMEVLSRMDHLIFGVGTFGWWAGYKNNGTVVCCKDVYIPGSKYGRQFWNNGTDFFYPGWILM